MIDIKLLRENPKIIKDDLKKRKDEEKLRWIDIIIKKDEEYRKLLKKSEELRRNRNELNASINKLKKMGEDASKVLKQAKKIPDEIRLIEEKQNKLKKDIISFLMRIPNITHNSVPYGKDDSKNVEIKKWGKIIKPKFELLPHGEFAEKLGGADFKKAAEVSGAGFYYMMGDLALLNQAIVNYAVDFMVKKEYKFIIPPLMLNKKAYEGVTDLADFQNVMYKIEREDMYMIATAEHPMAALYMNEVIEEKDLPIKLVGFSPCFRKEIGSRGVDTKGFFRVHQFWKVEQFIFCKPEDSWKFHEELQKNAEELYKQLEIPFRVVNICTGDLGIIAAKKYDIEAWFPRQNKYCEVGSNSNCTDYQARRLNIKYGKKGAPDNKLVHTLNNTAIATSRAMVAILENYQNKDGSLDIPKVLQPYMNKKKKIFI